MKQILNRSKKHVQQATKYVFYLCLMSHFNILLTVKLAYCELKFAITSMVSMSNFN